MVESWYVLFSDDSVLENCWVLAFCQGLQILHFTCRPITGGISFPIGTVVYDELYVTVHGKTYVNAYPLDGQKR